MQHCLTLSISASVLAFAMAIGLPSTTAQTLAEAPAAAWRQDTDQPSPLPFRFGEFTAQIDDLKDPAAVAIDDEGLIYIAEQTAGRISVFTRAGGLVRRFGEWGMGEGQLLAPAGVAVSNGRVYVADRGSDRVLVFDNQGANVASFGTDSNGREFLNQPHGLTVHNDLLYIADAGNSRVQIVTQSGELVNTINLPSDEAVQPRPVDVAVDERNNLSIIDEHNSRVWMFDETGNLLQQWGDHGPFLGLMQRPAGITVRDDRVFVADTNNHRIQVFSVDGEPLYLWGEHAQLPREGEGKIHYPNDLAIAPDGSFAVICEQFENRCQIFAVAEPGISEADTATEYQPQMPQTHFGRYISVDQNLLLAGEPEGLELLVFRLDNEVPVIVTRWGMRGEQPGRFIDLAGLAIDIDNNGGPPRVLVVDPVMQRLTEFELDLDPQEPLRFVQFASRMTRAADLATDLAAGTADSTSDTLMATQIARHPDGTWYLIDAAGTIRIITEDDGFHIQGALGSSSNDAAAGGEHRNATRFLEPTDIAFDLAQQRTYIVDALARRVHVVNNKGVVIRSIPAGDGDESGSLRYPFGVAIGPAGNIYVTDMARHTIVVFSPQGEYLRRIGEPGAEHGQLWKPAAIRWTDDGRLIVSDWGNHRLQMFDDQGQWLMTFGGGRATTREQLERRNSE